MVDPKQIAILTIENDIHALAIQKAFDDYEDVICNIVETNRICGNAGLCWSSIDNSDLGSTVPTMDGESLDIKKLDVIWWRRVKYPQKVPPEVSDPRHTDLINNDCRETLFGLLLNEFSGTWINDPTATRLAENKLIQLSIAKHAGFRIPSTIVSQDPTRIRKFCAMFKNNVIVKPVKGTHQYPLLTRMLHQEDLINDYSMCLCPAIYQEYIPGNRHIRAHCFGDAIHAALIESKELDWRHNYDVPCRIIDLTEDVKTGLRNVVKSLGLKMGIFDLKITEGSTPVWLELNPQGQFLFIEGLTGLKLISYFVDFLHQEAAHAKKLHF